MVPYRDPAEGSFVKRVRVGLGTLIVIARAQDKTSASLSLSNLFPSFL